MTKHERIVASIKRRNRAHRQLQYFDVIGPMFLLVFAFATDTMLMWLIFGAPWLLIGISEFGKPQVMGPGRKAFHAKWDRRFAQLDRQADLRRQQFHEDS